VKVSIITVVYNNAETISDCLQSVFNQDYPNIEYVVVDGGSNDGTMDILSRYSDCIAHLISEPDRGIYDAMNKGIAACSGEVVGILNSDDIYADERVISDVVEALDLSQSESCYGDLVYVNRRNTEKIQRTWHAGEYDRKQFLRGWMPPHPTFFVKRSCYEQYGTFNLDFKTSADYELMLRMLYKHGVSSTYLNRVLVKMRSGGQSNVSLVNRIKANLEDRKAWKVNGIKQPFFTTFLKPISKLGQFLKKGG